MSDAEEFGACQFESFTEEDFALIDAIVESANKDKGVVAEIEDCVGKSSRKSRKMAPRTPQPEPSPFQRYRSWNLSVSDIVAPVWCEVQFDYGLRQQRHKKLVERPKSFISGEGKEIFVEAEIAEVNDETQQKGRAVHKKLEREIRPEEITVTTSSKEERWALKLIDMLSCLHSLQTLGCAREMPVVGIVHGQVVTGIIDELVMHPSEEASSPKRPSSSNPAPRSPKKLRTSRSPPKPSPTTRPKSSSPDDLLDFRKHTVYLADTKTRKVTYLPPDEDTISGRLQLMLYHRLLSELTSTSQPFSFPTLWGQLGIDSSKPFSALFISEAALVLDRGVYPYISCLDTLVDLWNQTLETLGVPKIHRTLRLVYRTQSVKLTVDEVPQPELRIDPYEIDLQGAIAASLKGSEDDHTKAITESFPSLSRTSTIFGGNESHRGCSLSQVDEVLGDQVIFIESDPEESTSSKKRKSVQKNTEHISQIIGMKEFELDEEYLDNYLQDVLEWWYGHRPPRGVEVHQTKRCNTCEYRGGCEWREKKAGEIVRIRRLRGMSSSRE